MIFTLLVSVAPFKNSCLLVSDWVSTCLNASLTFAVLMWLSEIVLIPAGQRRISRVIVGCVLAVIPPQGALRPPFLHAVHLALLQCWPVREEVIAIQIFQTQNKHLIISYLHVLSSNTIVSIVHILNGLLRLPILFWNHHCFNANTHYLGGHLPADLWV